MLFNIAKVLIVYTCVSQSMFTVVPEENKIAEIFRNTLKNDQKFLEVDEIFIKKIGKLVLHSLYTCMMLIL